MSPGSVSRSSVRFVVAALAGLVATVPSAPPTGAEDGGQFSAFASSSGVRLLVRVPGYAAVEELTDFGLPVAQAAVDSLGESSGFASYPYPGDTFLAGPSTVAGAIGQGLPEFLSYPFIARSSHPGQPEAKVSQPGYELTAASSESASEATARAGASGQQSLLGSSSATARAERRAEDGSVVAVTSNRAGALNFGDVLRVASVAGAAKVTRTAGGEPARESSFAVEGLSVAGETVGLDPGGFVVSGTTVPAPNAEALTEVLAGRGITVRYLKGRETPDGVISSGMSVMWSEQVPNGPRLVMTAILGQAAARVAAEPGETLGIGLPVAGEESTVPAVGGAGAAAEPSTPISSIDVPGDLARVSSPVSEVLHSAESLSLEPVPAAKDQVAAPSARAPVVLNNSALGARRLEPTLNSFYGVLMVAAFMAGVATMVLRRAET